VPFLRVIRDKRGYETTYLMHWYRDGSRQRSRILYVFRSPGGVRVGRAVLEPDVQRQLERTHPDIDFDWAAVRENKQVIETGAEQRRRPAKRTAESESASAAAATAAPPAARPRQQDPPRPSIPSALEGTTQEEQVAFLVRWYPVVRERVTQRFQDPVRQEALLAVCERLNATAWFESRGLDAQEIATSLQQASEALERLSHVFSKRRRRPRRKPGDTTSGESASEESASAAESESPEPDSQESSPEPPAES
jgi:hypothetical protein